MALSSSLFPEEIGGHLQKHGLFYEIFFHINFRRKYIEKYFQVFQVPKLPRDAIRDPDFPEYLS
jgi:hypothetical protein